MLDQTPLLRSVEKRKTHYGFVVLLSLVLMFFIASVASSSRQSVEVEEAPVGLDLSAFWDWLWFRFLGYAKPTEKACKADNNGCCQAFNLLEVGADVCEVKDGKPTVKYPGYGGSLVPQLGGTSFILTTVLGRFMQIGGDCNSGTVWLLGAGGTLSCPAKPGILRGDGNVADFKGAIAVLDIPEATVVELFIQNLRKIVDKCDQTKYDGFKTKIDAMPAERKPDLSPGGAKAYDFNSNYYSKTAEAKKIVVDACGDKAKEGTLEQNVWLFAGVQAGQAAFWLLYNVPFMFTALERGDTIRLMSAPSGDARRGTYERELNLLLPAGDGGAEWPGIAGDKDGLRKCGYAVTGWCTATEVVDKHQAGAEACVFNRPSATTYSSVKDACEAVRDQGITDAKTVTDELGAHTERINENSF